jgi:integrase
MATARLAGLPHVSRVMLSMPSRRPYGSGSLFEHRNAWYGRWYIGNHRIKRKIGPKRAPGSSEGLTRSQAERRLRRMMEEVVHAAPAERLTLGEAGNRYIRHLEGLGRKRSTIEGYHTILAVHLSDFGQAPVQRIGRAEVEAFVGKQRQRRQSAKSIRNQLGLLHSIFGYAEKRGWARGNPVKLVDKPAAGGGDPDIRFLELEEVERLAEEAPADALGRTERTLYLTAALTGLRQGELIALRWRDIDWVAGRIRVRRSYVRGEYGTPKSKRSTRSVPLIDRLGGELERHYQRSIYQQDDDLVFPHPLTGNPLDRSKLLKRFKAALTRAGVGQFKQVLGKDGKPRRRPMTRFHDLRHSYGTKMAAAGVPLRTLQEWMGHRDFKTTLIYADYQPSAHEGELAERAFAGPKAGPKPSETDSNSEEANRPVLRDRN